MARTHAKMKLQEGFSNREDWEL